MYSCNMINRLVELPKTQSFFLFGPRQTGKSTLIKECYQDRVWTINLLHADAHLKYAKAPESLRREAVNKIEKENVKTIFIDEIQKVPVLLDEVHALMETHPACQFILTGSSARKLKRGASNLLAGRAVRRFLSPFTYQELGAGFDLEDVLTFGSLPAVYGKDDAGKADILKTYSQVYLKEEIHAEGIVRNLGGFSRFLDIAAAQSGDSINFTSLGRDARLPTRSVQSYYEILEDTLVGVRLEAWRKSERKRLSLHPKFYLFDLGVTNAINRRLSMPPDPVTRGRLFEQFIILEAHRILSYRQSECRLFYWRTSGGAEVDLVLERAGHLIAACEIKSSRSISGAALSGLRSFHEDHPQTPLFVAAGVEHAFEIEGVSVLPWDQFLGRLASLV